MLICWRGVYTRRGTGGPTIPSALGYSCNARSIPRASPRFYGVPASCSARRLYGRERRSRLFVARVEKLPCSAASSPRRCVSRHRVRGSFIIFCPSPSPWPASRTFIQVRLWLLRLSRHRGVVVPFLTSACTKNRKYIRGARPLRRVLPPRSRRPRATEARGHPDRPRRAK